MPELGTVNTNSIVGGSRLGGINSQTTVEGSPLGSKNSRTNVTVSSESLSRIEVSNAYFGSDKATVYIPPGYDDNSDDYPLVVQYPGSSETGIPTDSNTLIGTGNGSTTLFATTLSNSDRMIHSSIVVKVAGVTVATGRFGVITGTGVTGTYGYTSASSAVSVTFTTPPASSAQVRVYFTTSNILAAGPMEMCNAGDQPGLNSILDRAIIVIGQKSAGGGYDDNQWTDLLDEITASYRINTNRIYPTGFSQGGDMMNWLFINQTSGGTYSWAAWVAASPGSDSNIISSGDAVYATASNRGKLYVRGTSDPNGTTKVQSMMANGNVTSTEFPIQARIYWGLGHNGDTRVYDRKDRTDTAGTADFDYLRWLLRFSLDAEEQATLFTRYAEDTLESEDYRLAKRQVDNLSSGATKTTLLSDLSTLKASIGNSVIIDFGTAFYATSGNVNNVTVATAGTTVSSLVDDAGSNTGYSITITTATASSPAMQADIGSSRLLGRQFGFEPNTNRDGMLVDTTGSGTITFGSLNGSSTYTLKIYVGVGGSTYTARAELQAVFGGTTKNFYCDDNSLLYVKYTGLTPSSGSIAGTIAQRITGDTEKNFYLQTMELIEE